MIIIIIAIAIVIFFIYFLCSSISLVKISLDFVDFVVARYRNKPVSCRFLANNSEFETYCN